MHPRVFTLSRSLTHCHQSQLALSVRSLTTRSVCPSTPAASSSVYPARPNYVPLHAQIHPKYNRITTYYDPSKTVQDKLLFTPGPLTTSFTVKYALMTDLGSRDAAFQQIIKDVRQGLLDVAGVSHKSYTSILLQGSGTFAIESVLCSVVDKKKGVLVISNGAYGIRQTQITKAHNIPTILYECPDSQQPIANIGEIEKLLRTTAKDVSHISIIHSETTSGIINELGPIGELATRYNKKLVVDAVSSFGGYKIDFSKIPIDYLISSSNKCIEGVPGFAFIIARKSSLVEAKGNSSSLSLDLYAQAAGLDGNGQFRFTPPTHPLIAFRQALIELEEEGGIEQRSQRYKANRDLVIAGLQKLGFQLYLSPENQGYIVSSYRYPLDQNWSFDKFYNKLNDRGFVIYPGKVSTADCFRIGHIGRIFPEDTERLLVAIREVCQEMKTAAFAPGFKVTQMQ